MQSGVKLTSMEEIYIMALLPVHGPVYLELATDNHTHPSLDNYKISFTENLLPTACPVVPTVEQATSRRQSMGTVPDPLRSAKLSLVTASAEDDHLGDLQSAKHQAQLPSGERASNGFPCTPSGSAGVCLFDLKCTAAASLQSCKQCHEDNAGQHETSPPGLASKAAEGHPAVVEPAGCSLAAGSWEPAAEAPLAAEAPSVGQGPEMMPAPQSSRQFVQGSQAKTSSLTQMDDSVLKPQGTDDQPALEVLNYSSPGSPIKGNESCCTSQANLLQRGEKGRGAEKNASATCQSASPVRHTEADLGRDPQTGLEAKSGCADTALPMDNTEVMQSSETPAWSNPESPHPLRNPNTEVESDGPPQLSKFRETGTMTVQPESSSPAQEAGRRTWRDAEVQAVATVESKSASTSPSILAAFLKENPPPEEKEELHIIYQGGMGLSQFALTDSSSLQQKSPCSSGITSKSTVVTAVTASAQPQPVKLPRLPSDTASAASADNAKHICSSLAAVISQGASAGNAEMIQATCDGKNAAQPPIDAPVPPKPIPVEQLAVDSSNQTPAQSGSGSGEPSSTSAAVLLGTEDNVRDLARDAERSPLPLLCSTGSEVNQKEVLGSSEQKPVQSKGASQGEAVPNQSAVKPKEESLVVLGPAGGMNVSSQPAAVHVKVCSEDVDEKEESRGQGGTGQAQVAGSQSLQAGLSPAPGVSSGHLTLTLEASAPPQQDLQAKESSHQPHTAALPTSAQALPNLGENKKQPTPAMEAKVQVKQSKHVRDVVWDEQGMTWEVYGASLDAESLGIAIQNHLQRQIREHEKLIRAQNSQTRKSISSDTSSNKKLKGRQHNVFQSMLQNFRRPNCCVRPAPSSVLD